MPVNFIRLFYFMLEVLKRIVKTLLLLYILLGTLLILVAMTIDSSYGNYTYPLLNLKTFYDFEFTLILMHVWDQTIWGNMKGYITAIFKQFFTSIVFAFSVFIYYD